IARHNSPARAKGGHCIQSQLLGVSLCQLLLSRRNAGQLLPASVRIDLEDIRQVGHGLLTALAGEIRYQSFDRLPDVVRATDALPAFAVVDLPSVFRTTPAKRFVRGSTVSDLPKNIRQPPGVGAKLAVAGFPR